MEQPQREPEKDPTPLARFIVRMVARAQRREATEAAARQAEAETKRGNGDDRDS